jgi:hypothetical protein
MQSKLPDSKIVLPKRDGSTITVRRDPINPEDLAGLE